MTGLALCSVAACNLRNPGTDPPQGALSYPIALALGAKDANGKSDVLYVVNSNFDLRFNAGSVQAYDLEKLDRAVQDADCLEVGVPKRDAGAPALDAGRDASTSDASVDASLDASMSDGSVPDASLDASLPDAGLDGAMPDAGLPDAGPSFVDEVDYGEIAPGYETPRGILCDDRDLEGEQCCFTKNADYLLPDGEVLIDSYATGIEYSADRNRLYVPVRARDRLLFVDDKQGNGALSCGKDRGRCTRGIDRSDSEDPDTDRDPDQSYPVQPQALAIGQLSDLVPAMSMVDGSDAKDATYIATVHQDGKLALLVDEGDGPVLHSVAAGVPFTSAVQLNTNERLLYTSGGNDADVGRWGVVRDSDPDRDRWILYPSSRLSLELAAAYYDIRDLWLDQADPTRLFALMSGEVESVLFVERDSTSPNEGFVTSATRVGAGPSKLTHAVLGGRRLLFASCYDARAIFVIDEGNGELVSVIRGLAGPFDMEVDEARQRLYVADFRANVVRVVDVQGLSNPRRPPPRIIATLGKLTFGGKLE